MKLNLIEIKKHFNQRVIQIGLISVRTTTFIVYFW